MNRKACKLSAESVVSKKTKLLKLGIISFITGSVMWQFTILNAQIAFCMSERFSVILPWIIINMFKNIIEISSFFSPQRNVNQIKIRHRKQSTDYHHCYRRQRCLIFYTVIVSAGSKERGVKGVYPVVSIIR